MIQIEQKELLDGLKTVKTSVARGGLQPILETVKMESIGGGLRLTTTTLDNTTICSVPASVNGQLVACIPFNKLLMIIEKLSGRVILELEGNILKIESGRSKFELLTNVDDEFPAITENIEAEHTVIVDRDVLASAIKKVSASTASSEQSILSGINFIVEKNELEICSTDGNRLSKVNIPCSCTEDISFICPSKALEFIKNVVGNVYIKIDSSKTLVFECENVVVKTKVFNGQYPQYRQLIPSGCRYEVTVDKSELIKAIERVAIVADEKTNIVKMDFKNDELTLSADLKGNKAKDVIEIKSNIEDLVMAFNYQYVLEQLRVSDTDVVTIETDGVLSATLFKSDFLSLIMPVQLK